MMQRPRPRALFASVAAAAYHKSTLGMKNLFALFAGAMPFLAQTPAPLAPDLPQRTRSILDTIIGAGPVMIPLFVLSVFSVMLVIVYFLTIRRGSVVSSGYM